MGKLHFSSVLSSRADHDYCPEPVTLEFSVVQDGIYALGKALIRSTPSLRSFINVAFETKTEPVTVARN